MARRFFSVILLAVLGSLAAVSQQQSSQDSLPSTPFSKVRHQPAARGNEAAEYARWKSLTQEQRQVVVQQFHNQVLPLIKQRFPFTQKYMSIDAYVSAHWEELIQQSVSAPAQPRCTATGGEFIAVRRGNHRLTYPAQRVNIGSNASHIIRPDMPICGDPPDPDCCATSGCEPYNSPPIVTLSASPTSGTAPLTVTFTASASDRDGYIVDMFWAFGDGQTLDGTTSANHTYNSAGSYTATFTATDDYGDSTMRSVQIQVSGPQEPPGPDEDGDGIADSIESHVADLFTPYYHLSTQEHAGTAFGIMGDYTPEYPIALHGPVPPYSYYRVKPLGFATDNGTQFGVLRIDYLTLWNRDDGLQASFGCEASMSIAAGLAGFAFSELLPIVSDHELDNERSLMLVRAPTTAYNTYSTDPYAYKAYFYYTAAHEGTIFDQSVPYSLNDWPAGTHPQVALASNKHGTYMGDPDGLVLAPSGVIASAYFTLDDLYYNGWIDEITYWSYYFAISEAFYGCLVERFSEGGANFDKFADVRTNVGEPEHPINGSHFILDPKVLEKLQ